MSSGISGTMGAVRPRLRVRWVIFGFLFAFTCAAYLQRNALSVAAVRMMPELGLTQLQIGWLETAFLITYTTLQFPGGVLGEFLGARRMFALCGAVAVLATVAIPVLPWMAAGTHLFAVLLLAQLALGAAQAPLFAVLSGVLERWFPRRQWALTQGISAAGTGIGGAVAPAAIAVLMVALGWRKALVIVALPVAVLLIAWWRYGRDTPAQHRAVTEGELAELDQSQSMEPVGPPTRLRLRAVLVNRNLIGLTLSYMLMNVVFYLLSFWSFLYLVQARHFTVLDGGLSAAVPPLGSAAGAALGGVAASLLCVRLGARAGLRILPLITLPASGVLLLVSVHAASAMIALAGLTLAFALVEVNEGCFWAASMEMGREDAVAAGGILNTGGNLGGIIATPLVAWLSGGGNWTAPFVVGAGSAVLSAAIWLVIDPAPREVRA